MTMISDYIHNPQPPDSLPQYCTNIGKFLEAVIEPKDFHGTKVNVVKLAVRLLLYSLGKKVNCTLVQAVSLFTERTAHRGVEV
jgi:hypothetical protein